MRIDPETHYRQLGHLLSTMPDLSDRRDDSRATQEWLARACALVEAGGDLVDSADLRLAIDGLRGTLHSAHARKIETIVYRALARAELAAPASAQGAFIPAGNSFQALAAVSKVLQSAAASVLMVDPYADANILTDYAVLAAEKVSIRVLADEANYKPGLKPAAEHWVRQHGTVRPLDVRLSPARSLHDRLIFVDERDVFTVGQSFNALAQRAPTSVVRVDAETAKLKIGAFTNIWATATSLV